MYYFLPYRNAPAHEILEKKQNAKAWIYLTPIAVILAYILLQPLFSSNFEGLDLSEIAASDKLDVQQGSNIFRQLTMALAMIFSGVGLIIQNKNKRYRSANLILITPFILYCFLSVLWSPVPVITLKRCIEILGLLAIGLYAAQTDEPAAKILKIIRTVLAMTILLNLIIILLFPQIGITPGLGFWRGFLQHKNSLGAVTLLTVAIWLPAILEKQILRRRLWALFITALSFFMSIKSNSKTAIMINLVLIALWLFIVIPLPGTVKSLMLGSGVLLLALWFFNFQFVSLDHLAQIAFERSADLSGRTQLWRLVFEEFQRHPWLGIGYNGFWTSRIIDSDWVTFQAHNAYLDIFNELGIIGAVLFFASFIGLIIKSLQAVRHEPFKYLPYFLLLAGIAFHNLMESNLCRAMTRGWLLYLLIYVIIFSIPSHKTNAVREK